MEITKIDSRFFGDILRSDPNFTGIVEDAEGDRGWYKDGQHHREDGSAMIFVSFPAHNTSWCLEGEDYSKAEYDIEIVKIRMKRILDS
jgi:hypothetical protein